MRALLGWTALFAACAALPVHAQKLQAAHHAATQIVPPPAPPQLSPEAAAALEELGPQYARESELIQGWFRDHPVLYYNFGDLPQPVAPGQVYWPIHGFDARGNPVAMRGQRPIFSSLPGLNSYSGVWRLTYVVTADHLQPNYLRDMPTLNALVRKKRVSLRETNMILSLPIVARGTRLARDSTPGDLGWYEGRDVQYFDFGQVTLAPALMWRFTSGSDSTGRIAVLTTQNSVVDTMPMAAPYPDLWEIHFVHVDSGFVPNSLKNAAAVRDSRFLVDAASAVRNLPIVMIDTVRVVRAASPLRAFADVRSPFPPAPTRPQ